jgi:hypothetical protein
MDGVTIVAVFVIDEVEDILYKVCDLLAVAIEVLNSNKLPPVSFYPLYTSISIASARKGPLAL